MLMRVLVGSGPSIDASQAYNWGRVGLVKGHGAILSPRAHQSGLRTSPEPIEVLAVGNWDTSTDDGSAAQGPRLLSGTTSTPSSRRYAKPPVAVTTARNAGSPSMEAAAASSDAAA